MSEIKSPIRVNFKIESSTKAYDMRVASDEEKLRVNLGAGFTEDRRPANYPDLLNLPSLNGVTIVGDKLGSDYGLGIATNQEVLNMLNSVFGEE